MKSLAPATSTIRLADIDPNETGAGKSKSARKSAKAAGEAALAAGNVELGELQEKLYAESRAGGHRSVLVVLQGMDTSGKGGIVHHAFGGANPAGLSAHSFGAPTDEEKAHDFLWRVRRRLPAAGIIGVFDRSHYEDVLIHRVRGLSAPDVVEARYGQIVDFERDVAERGTTIIKVMLHISLDEQKERLLARLDRPDKHWKFSVDDLTERAFWNEYQDAYEIAIARTATEQAPWFVVPANHKWYARLAVQTIVLKKLRELNLEWPVANFDVDAAREKLLES
jgi:PPK2 family polyphosphate:nucleotide phosphotransferase